MLQVQPFEQYSEEYEAWFGEHHFVFESELNALKAQLLKAGPDVRGIEVGLGSGRYAEPLGIREGVEPSERMRELAARRGIEVMNALAERLPYGDMSFDFVLFVTLEHLDDVQAAFKEAFRVLKPGGSVIAGFIEKDSPVGQAYQQKRHRSHFYRHATFYPADRVQKMLENAGFRNLDFIQTLFGKLENIQEIQAPQTGYGEGSFIVVKADKK